MQKKCKECRKYNTCQRKDRSIACLFFSPKYEIRECFLCGSTNQIEEHHIFGSSNRKRSTMYGLTVDLCAGCHRTSNNAVHQNAEVSNKLKRTGQREYERFYGEESFLPTFGRNYL